MRKLLTLLLFAFPANAAIVNVQHTQFDHTGSVTSQALAYASNVVANNLLICAVRAGGVSENTITVTDSIGNTWTGLTEQFVTDPGTLRIVYAINTTSAANTVTVHIVSSSTIRMAILEYSGTATSSVLDAENNAANGTGTALAANSITPAQNNSLVIGAWAIGGTRTFTAGTNFTMEEQVPSGATLGKLGVEDWIQTTATATTAPMTIGGTEVWEEAIAVFKPSGGAAADAGANKRQKLEQLDDFPGGMYL